MLKNLSALLLAGLCIAAPATAQVMNTQRIDVTQNNADTFRRDTADEHWREGDGVGEHERNLERTDILSRRANSVAAGAQVAGDSSRVESRTQVTSDEERVAASDARAQSSGDRADRSGPVPFADLGEVGGGDQQLSTPQAIEQDRQLLVRGEIVDNDLVLHLPAGTLHDTLSLRSSSGLSLSRADIQALGRFDGDTLRLSLSDIGYRQGDLGNLWVWGTGPASSSLLQHVAMSDSVQEPVASNDYDVPQRRSAGISSTVGAPLNEPNMMSRDEIGSDDQIEKENQMQRDAGLEKSTHEMHKNF